LGAFLDGMLAASVGATIVWAQASAPLRALPGPLSDAGGCLLLTPLFLLGPPKKLWLERIREHKTEFGIGAALSGLAVVYLLLGSSGVLAADAGASFLLLLPLLWMAMRWSLEVAYPMLVAVIAATIAGTLAGYGPFSGVERGGVLAIFSQMAIGFGASVLLLGGAAREQQAAKEALRKVNLDLEERVEQRTAELRESQHQLEKAAFYDPLTGLPDRRLLQERFGSCGVAARRKGDGFGLLVLDLDHFKNINDRLGHDAGDAVLVETACRLTTAVRDGDVLARMGGDEFAIPLTETPDPGNIDRVCARIVQKLGEPIGFRDFTLNTSSSIGVALFPDHGATWQATYKAADMALYDAKHAGRGTWRWHLPETLPAGGGTKT
jgi:diguanylate cyclase (GGDEF)-like protein